MLQGLSMKFQREPGIFKGLNGVLGVFQSFKGSQDSFIDIPGSVHWGSRVFQRHSKGVSGDFTGVPWGFRRSQGSLRRGVPRDSVGI